MGGLCTDAVDELTVGLLTCKKIEKILILI